MTYVGHKKRQCVFFSHRGTVNRCVQLFKVYGLCGRKNATETRRVACACTRHSTWSILEKLSPHRERERERKKTHSPWVELVDDALEADDSEEPGAEAG